MSSRPTDSLSTDEITASTPAGESNADPSSSHPLAARPEASASDPSDEGFEADSEEESQPSQHKHRRNRLPFAPTSPLEDPRVVRRPNERKRAQNPYIDMVETLPDLIISMERGVKLRGQWHGLYQGASAGEAQRPLYVELGSGYGHFLAELAPHYPERDFLGIELKFKRLYKAAQRLQEGGVTNARYLRFDVLQLEHAFTPGEVQGIYINFPDPWPKSSHVSKRMVSPRLVKALETLLPVGGTVQLKSDWEPNREWFQESFAGSRFELTDYIPSLADWDRSEQNVVTSYERRFRRDGLPCFFFEYVLK